jgi:hypothetical protein
MGGLSLHEAMEKMLEGLWLLHLGCPFMEEPRGLTPLKELAGVVQHLHTL